MPKELIILDKKDFQNSEDFISSAKVTLFISDEAEESPANFLQVELQRHE